MERTVDAIFGVLIALVALRGIIVGCGIIVGYRRVSWWLRCLVGLLLLPSLALLAYSVWLADGEPEAIGVPLILLGFIGMLIGGLDALART